MDPRDFVQYIFDLQGLRADRLANKLFRSGSYGKELVKAGLVLLSQSELAEIGARCLDQL